jgi:hypothetical protein
MPLLSASQHSLSRLPSDVNFFVLFRPVPTEHNHHNINSTTIYRRIAAILCSAAVGVQATFFTTYDLPMARNKEHVLSGTQRQARALVNRYILGGNGDVEAPPQDAADTSDKPK